MKRSAIAAALALACAAPAAHASLQLCNRTSYVLYAATAAAQGDVVAVRGWTRIVPGACGIAIKEVLAAQTGYFVYARSSPANSGPTRAWSGETNLCTQSTNFSLRMPLAVNGCPSSDMYRLPFATINNKRKPEWTTTFRESPDFDSMQSAQRAGLVRLLADAGVRVAPGKPFDAALSEFRKRMRLPANAPVPALFDALETEAMKSAAPAGYTVCNDTAETVWAALGLKEGAAYKSRGWWTIAPGSCAVAISESVAKRAIYLHVERAKGGALVSGPAKFCVTSIEFEIQGRERCRARGLTEAGFAETNAAGASGFLAHVSEDGLAPPFAGRAGMSK